MCEGCVDICPWKCIHMVTPERRRRGRQHRAPRRGPGDNVIFTDRRRRVHPLRALRRPVPDGRHHPRQGRRSGGDRRLPHPRTNSHGYGYGMRARMRYRAHGQAPSTKQRLRPTMKDRAAARRRTTTVQGSQAWSTIFRPGSIFRKGYTDSPRNRSYVIMNSVLYHLHPVKVKRHAVEGRLHAVPRRPQLLPVHPADGHRHLPDVLLPAGAPPAWNDIHDAADVGDASACWSATCTDGPRT